MKKLVEEKLQWVCKMASAQQQLIQAENLQALTYYYHGTPGNNYEHP